MTELLSCKGCFVNRLQLLENAIVNYGGGIENLKKRAQYSSYQLKDICPGASEVLNDVANYLRDIIEVGGFMHKGVYPYGSCDINSLHCVNSMLMIKEYGV